MKITYNHSFPINLAYHILAQLDYEKEYGPASFYSTEYIKEIEKYRGLLLSESEKKQYEEKFEKYFLFLSFSVLRPWYDDFDKLVSDFTDSSFINKKIEFYKNYSYDELSTALKEFTEILKNKKDDYLNFWETNKKDSLEKIAVFKKYNENLINEYFFFLKEKVNPKIEPKNNYFVFLLNPLKKNGRGLEGGCAVGFPISAEENPVYTRKILHEITHEFSDILLKDMGFDIQARPGENDSHMRKEQFVEYILNKFIFDKIPGLAKQYEYNLITEEIKKALNI